MIGKRRRIRAGQRSARSARIVRPSTVKHFLRRYDKLTERMVDEVPVSESAIRILRELFPVDDDHSMRLVYEVKSPAQIDAVEKCLSTSLDTARFACFLEAEASSVVTRHVARRGTQVV
jgi:hypothetical protein